MKPSYKNTLTYFILSAITLLVFTLGYVGIKLKIDNMKKQIVKLNEFKSVLENDRLALVAEYQLQVAEERIKSIANSEIGLNSQSRVIGTIQISSTKLNELIELQNIEYEY